MGYSNSLYFSRLTFDTWQTSQNRMLIDYRRYKITGKEAGAERRCWTLLANLIATIGWSILSLPKALISFGRVQNQSWQNAREAGSRTKASLYACKHFKPLMETFRSQEARACYRSIPAHNRTWDKDDWRWKELANLCSKLTPEGFDLVWKEVSQGPAKVDFVKDLWKRSMSKELNDKVRKELFQLGWVAKRGDTPELYPVPFVEKMLPQKFPAMAPMVREVLAAKGAKELRVDVGLLFKCEQLLKKYESEKLVKELFANQADEWLCQIRLDDLKTNHLLRILDELPNVNQHVNALVVVHTVLYSRMQKLELRQRFGVLPNPKYVRQISEIRPKLEAMRLALFAKGFLAGITSSEAVLDGNRITNYNTQIYPNELMEIIQNPGHPKYNQKIAAAMASGGRAVATLSQEEHRALQHFVGGFLDGWTVKNAQGRVQSLVVAGLDVLAAKALLLTPNQRHTPELFNYSYQLLQQLCPGIARGIVDQSIPITAADAVALRSLLTRFPNYLLSAALLLWEVRQANAATLAPFIAPLRNCPKLDEILPELIEAPALLDPNASNIPGFSDLKQFLGQRAVLHPIITRRERSIGAAAIAGLISFDQMCEIIRRREFSVAGWSDWLESITARPIYNSPEELARIAWRNNPEQVRNLQSAILMKSLHPQSYSLNWPSHLGRMWEIANDEGKLSMLQNFSETNWWQRMPWAGRLKDFAQTNLALQRMPRACNTLLAYCMGHARDPNGPDLSFANPAQMLLNALRWQLTHFRDTCIERILEMDSHDIQYNLRVDQSEFNRALRQVEHRLHREQVPTLQRLAREAFTLFKISRSSEFGPHHHATELGRACKEYLTRHADEYRDVIDLNVVPDEVERARYRANEPGPQIVIEEWNQARAFIERALGRR
ncbi:MAG: hypothetical protein LLG04_02760 [Parachlamydia sp.]|nr:hypothetical protein [Parachlamydia sp.]